MGDGARRVVGWATRLLVAPATLTESISPAWLIGRS